MKGFLRKFRVIIVILCGVIAGLPVVFAGIGFLQWISMIPIALIVLRDAQRSDVKLRKMYGVGILYFMGFYLTAFHWFIAMYPLSFIDGMTSISAAGVVLFAWLGLSLLQASVSALVPVVIAVIARRGLCKRYKMLLPIGSAAVYTVFEWMQTLTWAGVPWARLAISQTEMPEMMKTASLFGSYILTFLIVAVNFYIAMALTADRKRQRGICISIATLAISLNLIVGCVLIRTDRQNGESFTVAAIQPNFSSIEKWTSDMSVVREKLEKYIIEAANEGATLIVTSESVFPVDLVKGGKSYEFSRNLARYYDVTLIIGCFTPADPTSKNSLLFIDPDGNVSETVYSKRHLVPFGEYVPMKSVVEVIFPPLAMLSTMGVELVEGEGTEIYESELCNIGGLICFDSIYENLTLESVRDGAELLVISTNDSWFFDSAAVWMHNAQAKLRAVESGRYIVRAANTGISSIIDHNGVLLDMEDALVEGYVIADVCARESRTLYSYIGNLLVWLSVAFVVVSLFGIKRKQNVNKNS